MAAVPVFTELRACYGQQEVSERYQAVGKAFKEKYGQEPTLFTRAPGRVNLIGEHIDYEGYGVLPMAIKQDSIVAIAKGGTSLSLGNVAVKQYPDMEFSTDPHQEVDTNHHAWGNYFVCAYKGVYDMLESKGMPRPEPCGLQVMMHGTVPLGSGLSSSAAFVCSCFLAIMAVHGLTAKQEEIAEYAARAERYVGVTSGGMDQAISMMGMNGVAKKVDFNPVSPRVVRAEDVHLPEGVTFVIGHSLAVSKKAEGAYKRYNLRVVECRLAAAMLAQALGAPQEQCQNIKTLKDVEPLIHEKTGKHGLLSCADAVKEHLTQDIYTHDEVEVALGVSPDTLYADDQLALKSVTAAREDGGFKLRQRAQHVFEEAQRVKEFKALCDLNMPEEEKVLKLGELMDASHASCSKVYECSCPEIEQLVHEAKQAGALGARLTGAGWGGCTVSLVREQEVEKFLKTIEKAYYMPKVAEGSIKETDIDRVLFASKPCSGAAVLKISP